MAQSIASKDNGGDYYSAIRGPCGDCCFKCPCPSILAFLCMLFGSALLLIGFHVAAESTQKLFTGTAVANAFFEGFSAAQIAVYCLFVVMLFMSVILLVISCLATGATRSVYVCRFKSRKSGRCQTATFLVIAYILTLGWIATTCLAVVPVFFMFTMNHGVCAGTILDQQKCLDLVQWALLPPDTAVGNGKELICGEQMANICNSNLLLLYTLTFLGCLLTLLGSIHFTINMSANFGKLLDQYKRTNGRKPPTTSAMQEFIPSGNPNIRSGVGARTNVGLVSTVDHHAQENESSYNDSKPYGSGAAAANPYATLELASPPKYNDDSPSASYPPIPREPVSNLQRAHSHDPLDYNQYMENLSRTKGFSRSAEPINFNDQYNRYDEYDI